MDNNCQFDQLFQVEHPSVNTVQSYHYWLPANWITVVDRTNVNICDAGYGGNQLNVFDQNQLNEQHQTTYFQKRQLDRNPKGKLYDRVRNSQTELRKKGLLPIAKRKSKIDKGDRFVPPQIQGTIYEIGYYVLERKPGSFNLFEIVDIVVLDKRMFLIVELFDISEYDNHIRAYVGGTKRNIFHMRDINDFVELPFNLHLLPNQKVVFRSRR